MTAFKSGDPTTLNRLYGRAKGKPLRAGQQALIDELLPQIAVPAEGCHAIENLEPRLSLLQDISILFAHAASFDAPKRVLKAVRSLRQNASNPRSPRQMI